MPTNQNVYNSRVTDEALEKRFRDTFKSQGGAELVDDLYAQGVIVPVVDFTAAATGDVLATNLQTAWDFSTGYNQITGGSTAIILNAGFWQVDLTFTGEIAGGSVLNRGRVYISAGGVQKNVWSISRASGSVDQDNVTDGSFVVFLRSGDALNAEAQGAANVMDIWYRQIATVNGDLVNPFGFTSS